MVDNPIFLLPIFYNILLFNGKETTRMNKEIEHRFKYHAPNGDQVERYNRLREIFLETATEIDLICPSSRELSLAMTHLEQSLFYANASIARNEVGE
jgi:hypothetical protein